MPINGVNYKKPGAAGANVWPTAKTPDATLPGYQKQMDALTRGGGNSLKAVQASGEMYLMRRDASCYERAQTEDVMPLPGLARDQIAKP